MRESMQTFRDAHIDGRRDARGSPPLVDRLRALLCARHSRSLAAQLAAFNSGCCATSAGCTVPLACLPASALGSARHGLSVSMQSAQACECQPPAGECECDRAPLDFEDGVMAASRTTSLASVPPSKPRRAWQFANSAPQLLPSDATPRGIWAWHMTNVTRTTRIVARLLQRAGEESAAAIPWMTSVPAHG
jgi:hypothetical protein